MFALAFVALAVQAQPRNSRTIYLVRHADKVSEDVDAPLNDAGRSRAQCLARTLADAGIQQVFTSDLQRTQQTAAPLAERLHVTPVAIPLATPEALVKAIESSTAARVLVVWHDATLPMILRQLGAPEITPIGHTEYDRFFVLTRNGKGKKGRVGFAELRYCDCG